MNDNDKFELGKLTAGLDAIGSEITSIREDLKDLKQAVIALREWRSQVIGISITLSVFISMLMNIWQKLIK